MMPEPSFVLVHPASAAPLFSAAPSTALLVQESPSGGAPPATGAPGGEASGGTGQSSSPWSGGLLIPMLAVFAVFYFVMIGPERKARKKREAMISALKKGDRVLTTGGMYASVAAIQDDTVTLQIDDGVRARFTRAAIQTVLESESAPAKDAPAKSAK